MTSAGNDIVALKAIHIARTKQPNFYSRIITNAEQELYYAELQDQLPFELFVWLAWSIKESAFKYLKRFDPDLIFSPSKLQVSEFKRTAEQWNGVVQSGNQMLYFQSIISSDFIFSMVNDTADFSETYRDIKQIESTEPVAQSAAVREFLLERLDQLFPGNDWQIGKNPHGWPVIANEEVELPIPVSFTHHDHFVAYSFKLTDSLWKAHQHHAEVL